MRAFLIPLSPLLWAVACQGEAECPAGSVLADDGLCYQIDDGDGDGDGDDGGDGGGDGTGDEGGDEGGDDSGSGRGDDGEVTPDVAISDVSAELSDVVTVVRVTWTTDVEADSWIEFGEGGETTLLTGVSTGTSHEALLFGNVADTEITFDVVATVDEGEEVADEGHTITTGSLPSGLPVLSKTGDYEPEWNYQVLPLQGTAYSVIIVDNQGRIVWYDAQETFGNLMRATISHDRESVVLCHAGQQDALEDGRIAWISLDGSSKETMSMPYVDHDMVELPDGTIAGIVVTEGTLANGDASLADAIVEMDADGNMVEIWNAWDHLDISDLEINAPNWTHGNGLDYLPDEDAYILSMKTIGTLAKVDRSTGETIWLLHGDLNQFEFPEGTDIVAYQHQFDVVDGGIIVFDNGLTARGYSRVVEVALDEENLQAEEVWEYIRDPSVYVYAKGDVHRFEDGTTQVVWSSSGELQLVDTDGNVLWQLNSELGQAITFVEPFQSFYEAD